MGSTGRFAGRLDNSTNQTAEAVAFGMVDPQVVDNLTLGTTLHPMDIWRVDVGVSASRITIDNLNNVYVSGTTYSDLDGSPNNGESDYFLIKFDDNGTKLWSKLIGSSMLEISGGDIIADIDNNIYLSGHSRGIIGSIGCSSGNPSSTFNNFLVKFNSSGDQLWVKDLCTLGGMYRYATALTLDQNSNITIIGSNMSGNFDGHGTGNGNDDLYAIKFDSGGNKLWSKLIGGSGHDNVNAADSDSAGNLFLSGMTGSDLGGVQNPGGPSTGVWYPDGFLMKLDTSGNSLWTKHIAIYNSNSNYGVALGSDNIVFNVYSSYNGDTTEYLLKKYDSSGNEISSLSLGSEFNNDLQASSQHVYLKNGNKYDFNLNLIKSTGLSFSTFTVDGSGNVYATSGTTVSKYNY
jgi:hypothetical protein